MSHALATNAPRLGRITRIVIPTVNSMTPTTPMNAVAETGRNCCAIGATDASQFASRLKNLSNPASVAIRPIAMRSAVTVPLSRVSMCRLQGNRVAGPQEVTSVLRLQGMHQERCMESRVGHMPSAAVRPDTLYAWSGPSLLVVHTRGECAEDQRLSGYYFRETRFLRVLQLRINGHTRHHLGFRTRIDPEDALTREFDLPPRQVRELAFRVWPSGTAADLSADEVEARHAALEQWRASFS